MGMSWNGNSANGDVKTTAMLPWWYAVVVDGIGKVGFPIVVTAWMLYRLDGQMAALILVCGR